MRLRPVRRLPWRAIVAGLSWAALAAIFAARVWGAALDDFFVTYRYAENLAQGRGFVFNPGERVFGTTAPGLGLLLALGRLLTPLSVPGLGTLSTAVALVALALLLLRASESAGRTPEALCAGTLLVTSIQIWVQHGSEMPVALALLLLAAAGALRWPVAAGIVAGFAVWCRPEAALGVGILAVLLAVEARRLPLRFAAAALLTVTAGVLAAWIWFGRVIPVTLEAKAHQAVWLPRSWPSGWRFWPAAVEQFRNLSAGDGTLLVLALGLPGWLLLARGAGRTGRMLALYAAALLLAYPLLRVAYYPWYATPVLVAVVYGFCFALGALVRALWREQPGGVLERMGAGVAAAVLVALVGAALVPNFRRQYEQLPRAEHYRLYRRVGLWLRAHSAPEADVAYVEIGTIGFFSERPMRDLLGLVTPQSLPHVRSGDMVGAFLERPTEFVLYDRQLHGFTDPLRRQPWFQSTYRRVGFLQAARGGERVVIYRRRPGAPLPTPSGRSG